MTPLDEREEALIDAIRRACRDDDRLRTAEPRIAGGWVRDKLIGRSTDDIDLVVADTSGLDFARRLARSLGVRARGNPEPTAHLKVGFFEFRGLEIECLQWRREAYGSDSRIPVIETDGVTLLEDARRRDFTVNALYYRIEDGGIDDPLGRGLDDLESGTLRSTYEVTQSFCDDPLRALRGVRFATRLGFRFDPELERAPERTSWSRVVRAIRAKLSRERIWLEMIGAPGRERGFLVEPDPPRALELAYLIGVADELLAPRAADCERVDGAVRDFDWPALIATIRHAFQVDWAEVAPLRRAGLLIASIVRTATVTPSRSASRQLARAMLTRLRATRAFKRWVEDALSAAP